MFVLVIVCYCIRLMLYRLFIIVLIVGYVFNFDFIVVDNGIDFGCCVVMLFFILLVLNDCILDFI